MSWLLALPIILPLSTAVLVFLVRRAGPAARWLSVAGCAALLGIAIALLAAVWRDGVIAAQMGGWPAPFGITGHIVVGVLDPRSPGGIAFITEPYPLQI